MQCDDQELAGNLTHSKSVICCCLLLANAAFLQEKQLVWGHADVTWHRTSPSCIYSLSGQPGQGLPQRLSAANGPALSLVYSSRLATDKTKEERTKLLGEFISTEVAKLATKWNTLKTVFTNVYHVTRTGIIFDMHQATKNPTKNERASLWLLPQL